MENKNKIISGVIGICLIGVILFLTLNPMPPQTESDKNSTDSSDPLTIEGIKFNNPKGFNLNSSSVGEIIFIKGESQISIECMSEYKTAKEYVDEKNSNVAVSMHDNTYTSMKIGNMTFYKGPGARAPNDNVDAFNLPESDKIHYSIYIFDFKDMVFKISIDNSLSDQESLLKEILGI